MIKPIPDTWRALPRMAAQASYTFLPEVYDLFSEDMDPIAWADDLISRLREAGISRGRVLDLGCGTGRISLQLARAGYDVVGIDRSEEMLRVAQERLWREGHRLPLSRQDMRSFSLHKSVDAVVCACDGINYLTDLTMVQSCFARVARALRPGGLFLFDISSRYKLEKHLGNGFFGEVREEAAYLWQSSFDEAHRLARMDLTLFIRGRDGRYERGDEVHLQRAHEVKELRACLAHCGLELLAVEEAFTRKAPRPDALRIQFTAVRQ